MALDQEPNPTSDRERREHHVSDEEQQASRRQVRA
jgi:hypothetical protein